MPSIKCNCGQNDGRPHIVHRARTYLNHRRWQRRQRQQQKDNLRNDRTVQERANKAELVRDLEMSEEMDAESPDDESPGGESASDVDLEQAGSNGHERGEASDEEMRSVGSAEVASSEGTESRFFTIHIDTTEIHY